MNSSISSVLILQRSQNRDSQQSKLSVYSAIQRRTREYSVKPVDHLLLSNMHDIFFFNIVNFEFLLWASRVRKTHVAWWHCHLESFCASGKFLRVSMKSTIKRHVQKHRFPDGLETFLMVWKVSGWSGKFSDSLESFWMVWKVSRWSGKFPDGLESFWMVWKVSRWTGKFPYDLENFRMVWKVTGWSGNFPDGLETFRMV